MDLPNLDKDFEQTACQLEDNLFEIKERCYRVQACNSEEINNSCPSNSNKGNPPSSSSSKEEPLPIPIRQFANSGNREIKDFTSDNRQVYKVDFP